MPRRAIRKLLTFAAHHRRLAVVAVVALGLLAAIPARAGLVEGMNQALGSLVLTLLQTVAHLTAMILHILVIVAQYNQFINIDVVRVGWSIVNDVANMMFIIALLVIAIGTILRVENYRYNRLLGKVIVMAFLTNFSKLIAGFLIQSGQVVMLTFVNGFKDAMFGNFASMFGLDKVLTFSNSAGTSLGGNTAQFSNVVMSLVAGLALMVVAMVISLAFVVVLIVRIVTLWALVILSPLAYALRILPNTEGYAKKWWADFGKWVTVGPIVAFFLWLALAILVLAQQSGGPGLLGADTQKLVTERQASGDYATTFTTASFELDTFINFMVAIIFLMMGLQYATAVGGVAGAWAGKVATAGFAAGAVMTGLNAIRDRTVRPVQGFLKQRQAQGEAGVRDRTLALGARYDQVMGSTVGGVGRAWTASTAGAGAVAKNMWTKKGRANMGQRFDEAVDQGLATGTRGYQQSQQRISQWKDARGDKLAGEMNLSSPEMTNSAIWGIIRSNNNARSARAYEEAMKRGLINPNNDEHVNQGIRAWKFNGDRPEGAGLRKAMIEGNPDLARKVLFNERSFDARLATGRTNDITQSKDKYDRFKEQLAADPSLMALIKPTIFKDETDENGERIPFDPAGGDLEKFDRLSGHKGDLGNALVAANAINPSRLKQYKPASDDVKDQMFKHMTTPTGMGVSERAALAEATGQLGRAFATSFDPAGKAIGHMTDAAQEFVNRFGGSKLVDMISKSAVGDPFVAGLLNRSPNVKEGNIEDLIKKSKEHNDSFTRAQKEYYDDLKAKGETYEAKDPKYKEQNRARKLLMLSSHGEENPYNLNVEEGKQDFASYIRSASAKNIRDLGKWIEKLDPVKDADKIQYTHEVIGSQLNTSQLRELVTEAPKLLEDSMKRFDEKMHNLAGPLTKEDQEFKDKYEKRHDNILKDGQLSNYVTPT